MFQTIANNWAAIITVVVAALPLAEVIVRLTPTKKDDTALDFIKKFLDKFIPNNKTGGGTHS